RPRRTEDVLHRGDVLMRRRRVALAGRLLAIRTAGAGGGGLVTDPPATELGDLLLQRHLGEEALDAVGDRQGGVPPGDATGPGSGGGFPERHGALLREADPARST